MNDTTNWDNAFDNAIGINDVMALPRQWQTAAKAFCQDVKRAELDLSYGNHPRETLDIFYPATKPRGIVVFVHGGYWMKFDKSYWSHLAAGAIARVWCCVMPSYTLAPEAKLSQMTVQIARAIDFVANHIDGPLHISGHSAGGHLIGRMLCEGGPLDTKIAARITHATLISGLFDLEPLIKTKMNSILGMTMNEAISESAISYQPLMSANITAWVGAQERPELIRQSRLLVDTWRKAGANIRFVAQAGMHHFNVIEGLENPGSPIMQSIIGE